MAKIRILPEQLANQIAAGEVVERPASVVKELIENSIDAGADRIDVEIEGGGTRLIRVIDNGVGMDEDDLLLCFERHGTSKIAQQQDLAAIESLGFRGEAIPSIASVAKMSITSRTAQSALGTMVVFEYGKLIKIHETGCSQGTVIEVRSLFGKTPARKKFLRTNRTELGHIDETLKNYALACPDIAFTLRVNGKETLSLNSGHDIEERLRAILNYSDEFIPIGNITGPKDKNGRKLAGLLIPPEKVLAGGSRLRLFINGRAIRDRLMSHAAFEGLRGFMLKGHAAAGYLHLTVPAHEIDVNVHPAKHEVRFRNSGDIHQYIKQNIENAMYEYQHKIRADIFNKVPIHDDSSSTSEITSDTTTQPHFSPHENTSSKQPIFPAAEQVSFSHSTFQQSELTDPANIPPIPQTREPESNIISLLSEDEDRSSLDIAHHGMRIIGQYKNLYIFCQVGENLLVIDQHAAHERLLFEKFRKQYTSGRIASQSLLFPHSVELSPFQIQVLENNRQEIEKLGFAIAEFGGNSYVISAIPAYAGSWAPDEVFFNVLDGYGKDGEKHTPGSKIDDILATMACKAAIKSGHELNQQEIDALLNDMVEADLFSHCPHGRPVFKNFTGEDVKKWFHRT